MPSIFIILKQLNFKYAKYVLVFCVYGVFGQNQGFKIPDSIQNDSFDSLLEKAFKFSETDTIKTVLYFNTYLAKAKQEKDSIIIAEGYAFLSHFETDEHQRLALLDSSIHISKDLKSPYYPMLAYSYKGGFLRRKNRFSLALDNYFKVLELAKMHKKEFYVYATMHNIATIKHDIGRDDEALQIYKQCFKREAAKKQRDTFDYLLTIRGLSESYSRNGVLDSAALYNKEGLKTTQFILQELRPTFMINEGINLFRQQKYKLSQDILEESITLIDNNRIEYKKYIARAYFYLGQIGLVFNNSAKAERHFLSVDSILQKDAVVLPELRKGYEFLMNYYKNNNESKDYLEYINRLLKFDSILYNDRSLISDRLIREYDTPMILLEKENAISALQKDKKSLSKGLIISILISIIAIVMFYFQFHKRRLYKKRFETLMNTDDVVVKPKEEYENVITQELDISEKIIEPTLKALTAFEAKKGFLKKNITTSNLSKQIGTNSKYLSKIVNHYKKKTFTNYVNDLRINHAVESLKTDSQLRRYTIQGIAEEMGFNTGESFSSAFKRSTGLKPSYFIKKISQTT